MNPEDPPTGYSRTPLARKLGYRPGQQVLVIDAPSHYPSLVAPLPEDLLFLSDPGTESVDLVHLFVTERLILGHELRRLLPIIRRNGAIWVSWPKKASKVRTDVTGNAVREEARPLGLVDVKVCAVDEVWSGMKFVIRTALR